MERVRTVDARLGSIVFKKHVPYKDSCQRNFDPLCFVARQTTKKRTF